MPGLTSGVAWDGTSRMADSMLCGQEAVMELVQPELLRRDTFSKFVRLPLPLKCQT